ncbi:MbtH family protein [Streptomyces globisporus]|uniref:MbtH family protein n=1 Tax=Streptomyces globisporus TaxID=1908 RepID=UPI0036D7B582
MTNPFDSESAEFLAVVNGEGQYSLWPAFADIPRGWDITFGPAARQDCLDFITSHWTDMRPKSLISSMEQSDT